MRILTRLRTHAINMPMPSSQETTPFKPHLQSTFLGNLGSQQPKKVIPPKDLVVNRRRVPLLSKLRVLGLTLRENGWVYSLLLGAYYMGGGLGNRAFGAMQTLRKNRGLPGINSRNLNAEIWDHWDWAAGGEEWTVTEEWKQSLVRQVLKPRVPADSVVVEIGPGAGRWTQHLIPLAGEYTGIDLSKTCVDLCTKRFAATSARFRINQGNNLPGVIDASVEVIWSFDVFVHINLVDIASYLEEFQRVLKPRGRAVIHHGTAAGHSGGWRSDATTSELNALIAAKGLRVVEQFNDWTEDGQRHEVGLYQDQVTVMEKP
jgi:ubiquinone/menaquinone biosynthesis C-methylase UbiE